MNKVSRETCDCCEGTEILTPMSRKNRPGLAELKYRIGTHASFLETMIARLSSHPFPELKGLTTRDRSDASIAMLDAWATVADVLTFYQERIANEGYLPTATERRSILELAKLVGYKLRPGVAASVYVAYTIDENIEEEVTIPKGSQVKSLPGPGEVPQTFETSDDLMAFSGWNIIRPRTARPQTYTRINETGKVYLKGTITDLKPNDPLLISMGNGIPVFRRVGYIEVLKEKNITLVQINGLGSSATTSESEGNVNQIIKDLVLKPSKQPANQLTFERRLKELFISKSELGYQVSREFHPELSDTLSVAFSNADVAADPILKVSLFKVHASIFGHNAPREPQYEPALISSGGELAGRLPNPKAGNLLPRPWDEWVPDKSEKGDILYLDNEYPNIKKDSYLVTETVGVLPSPRKIIEIDTITRSAYGINTPSTKITLASQWWHPMVKDSNTDITKVRTTRVYAQPEELELAEEPIEDDICGKMIELDGLYEKLHSGQWIIVSGERVIKGTEGVIAYELTMIASIKQDLEYISTRQRDPKRGESIHTYLVLSEELNYCFKRDTVKIYANVVKATHGESRNEILGNGDGSQKLQTFELKQFPLTHTAASNPTGVDSTLSLYINDIKWHEADALAGLRATDRKFITKTSDEEKTSVTFGNGEKGSRLPTGTENVRAEYRNGIGQPGNVKPNQISLLGTKPLGVKEVINPLRASGGADRENRNQARKHTPLAVKALDRLVSVQDYEDFTTVFAGIGKAKAVELSDGRRSIVHVTIAGADDIPIDETSDLYRNLKQALLDLGDPFQPIVLAVRDLMFIVISANIKIEPDYLWEPVVIKVRERLQETFGFENRELGQDVLLSEVISTIQSVEGVSYVDIDALAGIPEKRLLDSLDNNMAKVKEWRLQTPDEIANSLADQLAGDKESNMTPTTGVSKHNQSLPSSRIRVNLADYIKSDIGSQIRPAQLAFITPNVSETVILNQIKEATHAK